MPNILRVTVENAAELLNNGAYGAGAVVAVQSSATESGTYAAVSGTGATPTITLVAGTAIYTGYDPQGTSATWYRTRYESAGATRYSDWSAAFQVGNETAGLICALADAKQRLGIPYTDTSEDENLIGFIRQVGDYIEGPATGRWFIPRPLSGTTTYRVHTDVGRVLWLPKGVRSIATLAVADEDQPDSGGTYTTATAADYFIDPPEMERPQGWPGTRVVFRRNPSGPVSGFSDAAFGAEITGAFGWSAVPPAISRIALNMVVAAHQGRGTSGGAVVTVNIDGSRIFEGFLSKTDQMTLAWYRHMVVG